MSREEVLQWVTDALCGELDRETRGKLRAELARNAVLAGEAARLEHVWHLLGLVRDESREDRESLDRVLDRITEQAGYDLFELTDEQLDVAAGGSSEDPRLRKLTENDPE